MPWLAHLHATLHLMLFGCPSRLSLSGTSVCMSANWFICHPSLKIKSEEDLPPPQSSIFQTFSCFPSLSLSSAVVSRAFCQVSSGQGSARDLLDRAAVLLRLLGTWSSDTTAGEDIIITHTHTQRDFHFEMCAIISGYRVCRMAFSWGPKRSSSFFPSTSFLKHHYCPFAELFPNTRDPQLLPIIITVSVSVCFMFLSSGTR